MDHHESSADLPLDDELILKELLIHEFSSLLTESRGKIGHCVGQLTDEQIWWRPAAGLNSIGNLILHVSGNMRQWIVCGLTGAEDRRDRDSEFEVNSSMNGDELLEVLDSVIADVEQVLSGVKSSQLKEVREVQGFRVSGIGILMHSIPHLVGHTHQMILLTRMQLEGEYKFAWSPNGDRDRVPI